MAEYIDRDALYIAIMDRGIDGIQLDDYTEIQQVIADAPAADVEPVVRCINCKFDNACMLQSFVESESIKPFDKNTFFCADGKRK